jgi:peptidoglycan hydrolase-like protein with peptidoglycan-binding domain
MWTARGRWSTGIRRITIMFACALAPVALIAAVARAAGPTGGAGSGPTPTTTTTTPPPSTTPPSSAASGAKNPFKGRGMWIWELPDSSGGRLTSIIATAKRYGVSTLMIKSGDGDNMWSQFSSSMVATLHANGIRVCAWQFVYGNDPVGEANIGAEAVKDGANCLLIDAESDYEGKYHQAQVYVTDLRKQIGSRFPVGLAGFPYVDFHPAFPYSVFLGPGGAQYNVPQMYWKDIGVSVDTVYAHTYLFNRPYERPISPLGQVYNHPGMGQIMRFRQVSRYYGSSGISWWVWQQAPTSAWLALSKPVGRLAGFTATPGMASLGKGAQGDLVVWAQEHLVTAGDPVAVDGDFGPATLTAVKNFQLAHGLTVTGLVDTDTWDALLSYAPAYVQWKLPQKKTKKNLARAATAAGLRAGTPPPKSASLPARRDELAGAGGRGRP